MARLTAPAHSPSPGPQACVQSQGQTRGRPGASAGASVQAVSVTGYSFFIPPASALPMPVAGGLGLPGGAGRCPAAGMQTGPGL